jgi:hypothetical protein
MEQEVHLAHSDNAHIDRRFDEVLDEIKKISTAFATNADGSVDFEGHRRFHEEKLRAAKAEAEFWNELKLEIAKKGIWSLLTIICGLIVVGVSAKLGFGLTK